MNDSAPLLRVRELTVTYPVRSVTGHKRRGLTAAHDVSFDLKQGHIFGLVGESGCGKTSLARAIAGLCPSASGTIEYRQTELRLMNAHELRRKQREIQYLFQDSLAALSPRRSIWQTLVEPLSLYRIGNREQRKSMIENALQIVDLHAEVLSRYPHELSGGQRQRIALARALLSQPTIIIADEPMSSLDVSVQARMIELIRKVRQETGIAFLFISHDMAVVQQLADELAVMYLGRIVEAGPAARIFSEPAHPYTRALFQAVPRLHPGEPGASIPLHGEPPSALTPPPGCVFHTRCPQLMENCRTESPAEINLAAAGGGSHTVRCHLWNT